MFTSKAMPITVLLVISWLAVSHAKPKMRRESDMEHELMPDGTTQQEHRVEAVKAQNEEVVLDSTAKSYIQKELGAQQPTCSDYTTENTCTIASDIDCQWAFETCLTTCNDKYSPATCSITSGCVWAGVDYLGTCEIDYNCEGTYSSAVCNDKIGCEWSYAVQAGALGTCAPKESEAQQKNCAECEEAMANLAGGATSGWDNVAGSTSYEKAQWCSLLTAGSSSLASTAIDYVTDPTAVNTAQGCLDGSLPASSCGTGPSLAETTHAVQGGASLQQAQQGLTRTCINPATSPPETWACPCAAAMTEACSGQNQVTCFQNLLCADTTNRISSSWKADHCSTCTTCPIGCPETLLLVERNLTEEGQERRRRENDNGASLDESLSGKRTC